VLVLEIHTYKINEMDEIEEKKRTK